MHQNTETVATKYVHRLLEICDDIGVVEDLDVLLETVINGVIQLTEVEFAAVLLLDRYTGSLNLAGISVPGSAEIGEVNRDSSFAGSVIKSKKLLCFNSKEAIKESQLELSSYWSEVVSNVLGVPLISRGRAIGALELVNKSDSLEFNDQDIYLAQILAAQTALAIENIWIFQQTDLIADFMHELKTPLMALTAASELLARENLDQRQLELVDMMQVETMRLSKMAQDFLDLARLESGRIEFSQEKVDLVELLKDVARLQKPQAATKKIKITKDFPKKFPVVIGDRNRLKRALLNLTNNAIKYNVEGGRVALSVDIVDHEAMITISDTGPGISEQDLPHLFDRFYRLPDNEGFTEGTGLGLSIAAKILQEHGGRVEVESELGKGSSFHAYLPIQIK